MVSGVPIEQLDEETKLRLGIVDNVTGKISKRFVVLGSVIKSLRDLSYRDALWVLSQAQYQMTSENGRPIPEEGVTLIPPIGWVIQVVAREYGLTVADLKQRGRTERVSWARQVAMYILWHTGEYSLTQIGRALGGRTPSTVSHGYQVVAAEFAAKRSLRNKIADIMDQL